MAGWVGPAIVAAFISALVTAAGWYVSHVHDVRREAKRRQERVIDMQTAILAEIRASRHRLGNASSDQGVIEAAIADSDFTPFVPRQVRPFVFEALITDLHLLPTEVIDPVVVYYQQLSAIDCLVEDMREARYTQLSRDRKANVYRDYPALLRHLDGLSEQATIAVSRSLNIPDAAASALRSGAGPGGALVAGSSYSAPSSDPADRVQYSRNRRE